MNEEQFKKAQERRRIHRGTRPERRQHPEGAEALRHRRERLLRRRADVRPGARDAHPHHHQPGLRRRPHHGRDPVREDDGPRDRGPPDRRLPVERQERRAVPEDRQGAGRRGGRRADDEADARPRRPAGPRGGQRRLRHQGAIGHQTARRRPGRGRRAAVRGRPAGPRQGPRADHRAGGRHQEPAQGRGRRPAQRGAARRRQQARRRPGGHAQADAARHRQPLQAARRAPEGATGGGAVGWLQPRRGVREAGPQQRRHRELLARADRGTHRAAERRGVQRDAGRGDRQDRQGVGT